jgi:multiple sugar transport system substrate-binding protein
LLNASGRSAPTDWNQFRDAAKDLTVKNSDSQKIQISGAALGTYDNIRHAPDIMSIMFLQQGIDINKFSKSSDEISEALTFYTSFAKGKDRSWDSTLDDSLLAFGKGNLAMYFGFSWDIFLIEQIKAKSAKSFEYAIYPVPALQGGKSITVTSYWAEGVSSRSKNQKAAMLFMNYLTKKSTLQKFYTEASKKRLFGEPYPRMDMADELKDNPLVYPFVSNLQNAGSSYFASNARDGDTGINSRLNTYLENYVNLITDKGTVSNEKFKTFIEGVSKVLNEK